MGRYGRWLFVGFCMVATPTACGGDDGGGGTGVDAGIEADAGDWQDDPPPDIPGGDPSFGSGGLVIVDNPTTEVGALWSPLVLADGRIVAVGRTYEAIVAVRTTPSGAPDPSFGGDGVVSLALGRPLNGFMFQTGGVAVDDRGRLVIAGYVNLLGGGTRQIALRLEEDGALDQSFGDGGLVLPDTGDYFFTTADDVAIQPDGKILLAGTDGQMRLARLLPDGAVDPDFGTEGLARVTLGGQSRAWDVDVLADGAILAAGMGDSHVALARLDSSGALDPSFGGGGTAVDEITGDGLTQAYQAEVLADGRIAVAGRRPSTFAVGRLEADGSPDPSFGDGGWVSDEGGNQLAFDVAVQEDGKLVAVGTGLWGERYGGMARFLPTGELDTSFGDGGVVTSPAGNIGVALQADGKIVGTSTVLTRHNADGSADASFGTGGVASPAFNPSVDRALAMAVMPDGKVVVAGASGIIGPSTVVRLLPDGSVDQRFGTGGQILGIQGLFVVTALAAEPDGSLLVGGLSRPGFSGAQAVRLDAAGAVVTEFQLAGLPEGAPSADTGAVVLTMRRAADGSVLLAGTDAYQGAQRCWVVRYLPEGQVDASFGAGGVAVAPGGCSTLMEGVVAEQADGKILLGVNNALYRFTASGEVDTSFGTDGLVPLGPGAKVVLGLALQPDGGILLAATSRADVATGYATVVTISRFDASGQLDPGFGDGGAIREELGLTDYAQAQVPTPVGLAATADGAILLAAATGADGLRTTAALYRYAADGTPAADFGDGGRLLVPMSSASSTLHALTVDGAGRVLAAGRAWTASGGSELAVLRLGE